ncbi:amidase enhancer precursor [bacterium BMS3Abin05]|nr:amidase enhancer precursor [bacterium BMS3Abin05]GBE26526.1 amidase enhancer precursor [bacterium BMS3Bbin03]HDL79002.1 SpoIID/LytB domain-containing protein [Bacteroidota bacterium]
MTSGKKYIKIAFVLIIGAGLFVRCAGIAPRPYNAARIPQVRVQLLPDAAKVRISSRGGIQVLRHGKTILRRKSDAGFFTVSPDSTGNILIKDSQTTLETHTDSIRIQPERSHLLALNGKQYRGGLSIVVTHTGNLAVLNQVDLESYVKGVVPAEIGKGNRQIFEALKAQAVAARTYAFRKLQNVKARGNAVLQSTILDQVYTGADGESRWTNRAVEATVGEIVIFHGEPIYAFFSSTCGGRTEPGIDVWPKIYAPYLKGVADNFGNGDFCRESPHYRWLEIWSVDELDSILQKNLSAKGLYDPAWGHVTDLKVLRRFPSGRVKDLRIKFQNGSRTIHGNAIRWILTPVKRPVLRSTLFRLMPYLNGGGLQSLIAVGAGSGHGVGLCQWGAMGMAKAGYRYDQILQQYYRGTKLRKIY